MHKFIKISLRVIGFFTIAILTIIVAIIVLIIVLMESSCTETMLLAKGSGQGIGQGHVASYYLTECGATTPNTTVILIGSDNDTGLKNKNVIYRGIDLNFLGMEWVEPKKLKINFSGCQTRVFVQKEQFKDIDIQYEIEKPIEGYPPGPCKW